MCTPGFGHRNMPRSLVHIGIILFLSLAGFNCSPSDDKPGPIAGPSGAASRVDNPAPTPKTSFTNSTSERPGKAPGANSKLRMRLKRDIKGKYSWEITGDDVRQIVDTDRQLRKKFGSSGQED